VLGVTIYDGAYEIRNQVMQNAEVRVKVILLGLGVTIYCLCVRSKEPTKCKKKQRVRVRVRVKVRFRVRAGIRTMAIHKKQGAKYIQNSKSSSRFELG